MGDFTQEVVDRWNGLHNKYPNQIFKATPHTAVSYEISKITNTGFYSEAELLESIDNLGIALAQPQSKAGYYQLCKFLRQEQGTPKFHPMYFVVEHYQGARFVQEKPLSFAEIQKKKNAEFRARQEAENA